LNHLYVRIRANVGFAVVTAKVNGFCAGFSGVWFLIVPAKNSISGFLLYETDQFFEEIDHRLSQANLP
jgi:hypothetical protein